MTDIPHLTDAQRQALDALPSNRAWLVVNEGTDVGLIVSFIYLGNIGLVDTQGISQRASSYRLTSAGQAVKASLAKEQPHD